MWTNNEELITNPWLITSDNPKCIEASYTLTLTLSNTNTNNNDHNNNNSNESDEKTNERKKKNKNDKVEEKKKIDYESLSRPSEGSEEFASIQVKIITGVNVPMVRWVDSVEENRKGPCRFSRCCCYFNSSYCNSLRWRSYDSKIGEHYFTNCHNHTHRASNCSVVSAVSQQVSLVYLCDTADNDLIITRAEQVGFIIQLIIPAAVRERQRSDCLVEIDREHSIFLWLFVSEDRYQLEPVVTGTLAVFIKTPQLVSKLRLPANRTTTATTRCNDPINFVNVADKKLHDDKQNDRYAPSSKFSNLVNENEIQLLPDHCKYNQFLHTQRTVKLEVDESSKQAIIYLSTDVTRTNNYNNSNLELSGSKPLTGRSPSKIATKEIASFSTSTNKKHCDQDKFIMHIGYKAEEIDIGSCEGRHLDEGCTDRQNSKIVNRRKDLNSEADCFRNDDDDNHSQSWSIFHTIISKACNIPGYHNDIPYPRKQEMLAMQNSSPLRRPVKHGELKLLTFILYTLFTSSLLLCFSPRLNLVQCTKYYWPLRRLNQHQHQQQPLSPSPPLTYPNPSAIAMSDSISNSPSGSMSETRKLVQKEQQQQQQPPLKRHQLLIGQQYSNFSSVIPYSLIQDSDYSSMMDVTGQVIDPESGLETVDVRQQQLNSNQHKPLSTSSLENAQLGQDHLLHNQQQHPNHQDQSGFSQSISDVDLNPYQSNKDRIENPLVDNVQVQHQHPQTMSEISKLNDPMSVASFISDTLRKNDHQYDDNANSRALLPFSDSNRLMLPQMQQIKARFNQGCVGGTKCQFFAFCWMSGGSLGASCGLLMTCCVTPSRHEIQPGFYGPVVNDPYCGRGTSKINRIVGGTDASFGQFPWQAFVQVGGSRCGGALISSRHVVTAGHCVARSQHSPSSIKVTLGDYILNSDIESIPHEVFSVVEVFLHPNFRFTPQADRYDVAVLELDRQASYKDNIKPICLPQKDAIFVGRVAYVAGWGALQAGSKLRPKVLQHVAVPVIENQVCESWHRRKGIDIRIYDEMMCAGYELGQRDACQGDSGGPLMLNQFGVWYLVGIVSAGYSCAKQYQPGIYHRVSSSSDWISSNVYQQGGAN